MCLKIENSSIPRIEVALFFQSNTKENTFKAKITLIFETQIILFWPKTMPPLKKKREYPNTTVEHKLWVVRHSEENESLSLGCSSIVTPDKSPNFSITYFKYSPDSQFIHINPHFGMRFCHFEKLQNVVKLQKMR